MLILWLARTYFIATIKLSRKEYTLFKPLIYLPEIGEKQESTKNLIPTGFISS